MYYPKQGSMDQSRSVILNQYGPIGRRIPD